MKKALIVCSMLMLILSPMWAKKTRITTEEYINKYSAIAIQEMNKYGIPASITLAQGILESESGNSKLATKANNHFGIKKHDWKGPTIAYDDDRKNELFRKYRSAEESFEDHSKFLTGKERYAKLFELDTDDYKGWAKGLKKAGYATNPKYPKLLIDLIERYELYDFDKGVVKNKKKKMPGVVRDVYINNHVKYVIVKEGETLEALAQKFRMREWELPHYNNLPEGYRIKAGEKLYIRMKRSKCEKGIKFHRVKPGETLRDISQTYGVRISSILKKNRMKEGEQIDVNQVLFLRYRKPKGFVYVPKNKREMKNL